VLIAADGRIAAAGAEQDVPAPPGVATERFPGVLLPGLVNAHTHLELTGLDGQAQAADFPAWIREVIALKAARTPADFLAAARRGLRDCWAGGVTTVADTGDSGAVIQAMAEADGSGIAYYEVFGPAPEQAEGALAAAVRRLDQLREFSGPRVRLGLSPHAPYSVSGALYAGVASLARALELPLAVHVAESRDETLLLQDGSGGFGDQWRARGIAPPAPPGATPVQWLDRHGVLGPSTLCIHAVSAGPADLDLLVRRRASVAHCPRSNRRHGHGDAPLGAMLQRAIPVGAGTDSVASVAPLDLLADLAAARALAGLTAEAALELATVGAARALGLEGEVGSLTPGKWGDVAAVDLPGPVDAGRLADTLLSRRAGDVRATFVAGRDVWRRDIQQPARQ
jgi:5-methylthioadenosine/S-adenosylhomocysteine deaminase